MMSSALAYPQPQPHPIVVLLARVVGGARESPASAGHAVEIDLDRVAGGNPGAFDRIFEAHKDSVHSLLWHLLGGDEELVEEALGNVFLSVYKGLPSFRRDASFTTWLYRITVNESKARLRARLFRIRRSEVSLQEDVLTSVDASSPDPAGQVADAEMQRLLVQAVHALPEPYRTPVVLRYLQDLSSPEISEILKRPAGTVRYQISRGIELLRERLGDTWEGR